MRVWAAHAVFAIILVGSLAARGWAARPLTDDGNSLERSVVSLAQSRGWVFRKYENIGGMVSHTLVFDAPGCSQPVQVGLRLSTFEEEALAEPSPKPGYVRSYVYFDRTWDRPAPRAVFVLRMKYAALAPLGLTGYTPSRYLLRIEAAANCSSAQAMDWRSAWTRGELAAEANAGAAPKEQ